MRLRTWTIRTIAAAIVVALFAFLTPPAQAYKTAPFSSMEEAEYAEQIEMHWVGRGHHIPAYRATAVHVASDEELARRQSLSASERVYEMAYWHVMYEPSDIFYSDGNTLYLAKNGTVSKANPIGTEWELSEGLYELTRELEFEPLFHSAAYVEPELKTKAPTAVDTPTGLDDPSLYFAGYDVIYRVAELSWTNSGFSAGDYFQIEGGAMYHITGKDTREYLGDTSELPDATYALHPDFIFRSI